jgi:predicted amidohydrolase
VFDWQSIKFGIQICYDRLFPEPSRALALKGAEVIFMPICYSTYSDPAHRSTIWDVPLRSRAYENGVYVVAANRVGQEGQRNHLGRSMVVDPTGAIVCEAGGDGGATSRCRNRHRACARRSQEDSVVTRPSDRFVSAARELAPSAAANVR